MRWQDHIAVDPAILSGKPCIRGTRISVSVLLADLAAGRTPEQLIESYPTLTPIAIETTQAYAADHDAKRRSARRFVFGFYLLILLMLIAYPVLLVSQLARGPELLVLRNESSDAVSSVSVAFHRGRTFAVAAIAAGAEEQMSVGHFPGYWAVVSWETRGVAHHVDAGELYDYPVAAGRQVRHFVRILDDGRCELETE